MISFPPVPHQDPINPLSSPIHPTRPHYIPQFKVPSNSILPASANDKSVRQNTYSLPIKTKYFILLVNKAQDQKVSSSLMFKALWRWPERTVTQKHHSRGDGIRKKLYCPLNFRFCSLLLSVCCVLLPTKSSLFTSKSD